MKYFSTLSLFFLLFGVFHTYVLAQDNTGKEKPKPLTRILFVYDASLSMTATWQSDKKITIASKLMAEILDSLRNVKDLQIGLRVYGHQKSYPPQDCNDTKLEIPIGFDNVDKIKNRLKTLIPRGTTPIAASLEAAGNDFTPLDNCRNIIVLITDGLEECSGDPCAVSQSLQKKGVVLKPFIIGIGRSFSDYFNCVGTYFDASTEKEFTKALKVVISQALNSTTAQVNLLDTYGNPTETNVGMTFYDNFSGVIKYNFVHTFNNQGLPDTLVIDPLLAYDLVVHTIPPVKKDSIAITPGKHTTIAVSTPQGTLDLKIGGSVPSLKSMQCIVRKKGQMETLNLQSFDENVDYLTGSYDLEILTLPRMHIKDVEIKQSSKTTVEIPTPGIAVIDNTTKGYGALYVEENNKLTWIYNLNREGKPETLYLLPGKYRLIYRSKFITKSIYTVDKSFTIESGITNRVNYY